MTRHDFLLDSDGDLLVRGGDLCIGPSGDQEIRALLLSYRGNWLQSPFVGVGAPDELLNDGNLTALQQDIITQLTVDGFADVRVGWDAADNLQVTAK